MRLLPLAVWVVAMLLLAVVLTPSTASASDCHDHRGQQATAEAHPSTVEVVAAATAPIGRSGSHDALPCCQSSGCLTMHTGLSDAVPLPAPLRSGRSEPLRLVPLADGLGVAPALPPPRTV